MIRKLIFTAAALVALSAGAQAGNTVTTTQFGSLNNSTTTQIGGFAGSNTATLSQFGGFIANNATATQVSIIGTNTNTMFQDSEASPVPNNTATVNQFTFGTNNNHVTQVP
jgi:hypothetical protein